MSTSHETRVAEARAKLAEIRERVAAMPASTVPPEALHEPSDPASWDGPAGDVRATLAHHQREMARHRERMNFHAGEALRLERKLAQADGAVRTVVVEPAT